jgi:hypothetical protein
VNSRSAILVPPRLKPPKRLSRLKLVGIAFAFLIVALFLVDHFSPFSFLARPKDAALVAQFTAHKAAFEELRQMLAKDANLKSVQDWGVSSTSRGFGSSSLTEAGISKDRYDSYMQKLERCRVSSVIRDNDGCRFLVAASGFASKGYRICIAYRESKPETMLASLDDFKKTTHDWQEAYRQIEGNWYLWIIW